MAFYKSSFYYLNIFPNYEHWSKEINDMSNVRSVLGSYHA